MYTIEKDFSTKAYYMKLYEIDRPYNERGD